MNDTAHLKLPGRQPQTQINIQYSHYKKDITNLRTLDIYRILKLYNVTDPCIAHAVKKLLCPGGRGAKSEEQDIIEAIATLNRYLDMRREDGEN